MTLSWPHCPWGAQRNKLQPARAYCVEGKGQAHPGSALKGPLWLLEEADGSPDPVVEGLVGVWSRWSGPWR